MSDRQDNPCFTQVWVFDISDVQAKVLESYTGDLQVRLDRASLSVYEKVDLGFSLHATGAISYLNEHELVFEGFAPIGTNYPQTFKRVRVVLTRPGTGWDEE